MAVIFADWQSCSDSFEELLDPVRSQYKEAFVVVRCRYGGEPYSRCVLIWVDKDFALVRGWHQGYPKKLGSIWMTRPVPHGRAGPRSSPAGGSARASPSHDRRVIDARFTITGPSETNGFVNALPMLHNRYFPSIEEGRRASMDELVTMKSYDWEGSDSGPATPSSRSGLAGRGARNPRAGRDARRLLAQRRRELGHRHPARLTRVVTAVRRSTRRRRDAWPSRRSACRERAPLVAGERPRRDPFDPVRADRSDRGRRAQPAAGGRSRSRDSTRSTCRLLCRDRTLFEYWAHAASIVLTEDYPIHTWWMRTIRRTRRAGARTRRVAPGQRGLRRSILRDLRREGPLPSRRLVDIAASRGSRPGGPASGTWTRCCDPLDDGEGVGRRSPRQERWWDPAIGSSRRSSAGRRSDARSPPSAARSSRGLGVGTAQHVRAPSRMADTRTRKLLEHFERTASSSGSSRRGRDARGDLVRPPGGPPAARSDRGRAVAPSRHAAVAVRQPDRRSQALEGAVRPRLPDRDLHPEGRSPVRLLRDAGARRRSVRRAGGSRVRGRGRLVVTA